MDLVPKFPINHISQAFDTCPLKNYMQIKGKPINIRSISRDQENPPRVFEDGLALLLKMDGVV